MVDIQTGVPLAQLTTMGVGGTAEWYAELEADDDLPELLSFAEESAKNIHILGGGSNVIIADGEVAGLFVRMKTSGISIVKEGDSCLCEAAAGVNWDAFVDWAADHGLWGVENMSLIPGTVGAVAVQNVGAYGQQTSDVLHSLEVYDREKGYVVQLAGEECRFAYRESIFNTNAKGRYVILRCRFCLLKNGQPNLSYQEVLERWSAVGRGCNATSAQLRKLVCSLRKDGRLPDPSEIGNVGSFFKNQNMTSAEYAVLLERLASRGLSVISAYKDRSRKTACLKVSAALLIRAAGAIGITVGGAMLYDKNPIVVVNKDNTATAKDVYALREAVLERVCDVTGVQLSSEPEFIGFEHF